MDIVYRVQGVEFEWDEDKAQYNVQRHGITFEEATEAFFDPFYQAGDASADDERRTLTAEHGAIAAGRNLANHSRQSGAR